MLKKALLAAPLALAIGCASVPVNEEPSPLPSLKPKYESYGLTDDDFVFDLVLGTRLAGIEFCGAGDVTSLDPAKLSTARLEHVGRLPAKSISPTLAETISYAKSQGMKLYEESGKKRACNEEHMELLQTNFKNFSAHNVEAYAGMKKLYMPRSRFTKQRPTNGILNSGITQAGL